MFPLQIFAEIQSQIAFKSSIFVNRAAIEIICITVSKNILHVNILVFEGIYLWITD